MNQPAALAPHSAAASGPAALPASATAVPESPHLLRERDTETPAGDARVRPALPGALDCSVLEGPASGAFILEGQVPQWLSGQLLRTAPGIFELKGWQAQHWFDGLGLLFRLDFQPGRPVQWRQGLIECEYLERARAGRPTLASYGTRSGRPWWQRLLAPVGGVTDNANVNIRHDGERWVAMTETYRQLEIDPTTLGTRRELAWSGTLPHDLLTIAHPQLDPASGGWINIGGAFGPRPALVVFRTQAGTQQRTEIGRLPLRRVPYVHSFGITPTRVVLVLGPFELNPVRLLGSARPIGEHYRWTPEHGTRIVVLDRRTGTWSEQQGEACFTFHTVNAWDEDDGRLAIDFLAYADASIIQEGMRMDAVRAHGLPTVTSVLRRARLSPGRSHYQLESLAPGCPFEFPAINQERVNGRHYRYVWGSDLQRLHKLDVQTGELRSTPAIAGLGWGARLGEPVLVPRPGAAAEDEGVLLTVAGAVQRGFSEVTVWDAGSLDRLATGIVSTHFPMGFHGSFRLH